MFDVAKNDEIAELVYTVSDLQEVLEAEMSIIFPGASGYTTSDTVHTVYKFT